MLLLWTLCASPLPFLVLTSEPLNCNQDNVSSEYVSTLMESLQCYNDYASHINCRWTESEAVHRLAPLSLYHIDKNDRDSLCVPFGPLDSHVGGQLTTQCRYNTSVFAIGSPHTFFFKTPHSAAMSRTIHLSQHVKVGPPQGLSRNVTQVGSCVLSWKSPLTPVSPLYPTLNYQIRYRRLGQRWTTLDISEMKWDIGAESLVPGSSYEATVRARSGRGPWSDWSAAVSWQTEEASGPRGPYNLQCFFDGNTTVDCSWELHRDLAESVTYRLSYRTNSSAAVQQCCGATPVAHDPSDPILQFRCSFPVSHTEELQVHLTPEYNKKKFWSHTNIQLPPPGPVKVTEKNQVFELSWKPPVSSKVTVYYQVRYWSMEMQEDLTQWNFSQVTYSHSFHSSSLRPSTRYWVQVRVLVASSDYQGPPSDWTEAVTFTTHPAPWFISTFIYIFTGVVVTVLFFILYFSLPAFHRRLIDWEVSLPSPIKSKVMEEILKHSPNSWVGSTQAEKAYICNVQILESPSSSSCSEDTGWDAALDRYNFRSPPSSCDEKQEKDTSSLSFNGPYLLCHKMSQSLSHMSEMAGYRSAKEADFDSELLSTGSHLTLSMSESTMGYVSLPSDAHQSPPHVLRENVDWPFASNDSFASNFEAQDCTPPAYTPTPAGLHSSLLQHISVGLIPDTQAGEPHETAGNSSMDFTAR